MIKIDGSKGEGGGQILRTSLSLSAITGKEIVIEKIRAGREKPGLKRQHLTCVKAVAEICSAETSELEVGVSTLHFKPDTIKAGDYRFDVGTAGSVTLVAQAVIPVLLMADSLSTVVITGGTHVSFAPTYEFFDECYISELRKMGANIETSIERYGFYPAGGGMIKLKISPFDKAIRNKYYTMKNLGAYSGGYVEAVVSDISKDIAESECKIVGLKLYNLGITQHPHIVESVGPGNFCIVKLTYENATVVFSSIGSYRRSRKAVASEVSQAVQKFVKSEKSCEVHLADQLLLPYALLVADGIDNFNSDTSAWLDAQEKSLHFTTNLDVINYFKTK